MQDSCSERNGRTTAGRWARRAWAAELRAQVRQSLISPWSRRAWGPVAARQGAGARAFRHSAERDRYLNSMAPPLLLPPPLPQEFILGDSVDLTASFFPLRPRPLLLLLSSFLSPLLPSPQNFSNGESVDLETVGIRGRFVRDIRVFV